MPERRAPGDRVRRTTKPPRLSAIPLAAWEREGVVAALRKVGLPADDVEAPDRLFWRFETTDLVPVGFGGLELYGTDALLRSLVTLPPLRRRGMGAAMVAILEVEARARGCSTVWLLTMTGADFFGALGYITRERSDAPEPIRQSLQFSELCPAAATLIQKPFD
jgi:N-acetylglutamate synthase-like GNAT family acetyltransferase